MTDDLDELAARFRYHSASAASRAPLYQAMGATIADDRALVSLLLQAPPTQRLPVLLLASIHALVLDEPESDLAQWYPNVAPRPRSPASDNTALATALRAFCEEHHGQLVELIATRSTQTNEVGRCALLVPVFTLIAQEAGPLAHIDVGASAGLNLLWPQYAYRYEPGGDVGGPSPVEIDCGTRGDVPIPDALPPCAAAAGLDRSPVDSGDEIQARWLEACVWPDQLDRFRRLRAALEIARDHPPDVRAGDAVTDVGSIVEELAPAGHPVVTNSWVLNYFSGDERRAYLDALDGLGSGRDLTWVFLEAPELVPELPVDAMLRDPTRRSLTVLTVVRWRDGERSVTHAATCHPHGYWMHWLEGPPSATDDRQPR